MSDVNKHPGEIFLDRVERLEAENWDREPFLRGENSVDLSNTRVTSLLYNKMVNMPPPSDWEHEVVIQQQQLEVLNILDDYMLQQCDNNGRPIGMVNLTGEQALGRKEILQGIKTRKWKLYGTDKSEKLVLYTEASYMRAIAPNI